MESRFEAPEHLSTRAKSLWAAFVPERARSTGRLVLLTAALESLDRADSARAALAGESLTTETKTTGALHVHPLLKVERESRQQFAKLWADLGFTWDQMEDGCDLEHWLRRQQQEAAE